MKKRPLVAAILFSITAQYAFAQDNPFTAPPPANPFTMAQSQLYVGVFESDAVRLELVENDTGVSGTLYYDATGQTYPITAQIVETVLDGSFSVAGTDFAFTFALADDAKTGQFETEGYNGVLSAHGIAPPPPSRVEEIFDEAISLAAALPAEQRGYTVAGMVSLLAETGDTDGAMELTGSLPAGDVYRSAALVGVAGGLLKTEGVDAARQLMNGVVEPSMRSSFDARYAGYLTEQGQLSEAYTFASGLSGASSVGILTIVAQSAREAGDTAMGDAAFADAVARASGASDKSERNTGFFQLAISQASLGDVQATRSYLDQIDDDFLQVIAYVSAAEQFVRDGNRTAAEQLASDAFRKAKRVKPKAMRPSAVMAVTPAYAALRDTAKLQDIVEWVNQHSAYLVGSVWNSIIRTQIRFRYLDAARSNAAQLTQTDLDSEILQAVAYDQADAGDIDGALQTVRSISVLPVRITSLATIAHKLYLQSTEA